jgi:hypothetical protein
MDDDRNPAFVKEFYAALRSICQDLFMARARPVMGSTAAHPLESVFNKTSAEERPAFVNELIDLYHDPEAVVEPKSKYAGFLSAAELQKSLGDPAPTRDAATLAVDSAADRDLQEWVALLRTEADLTERLKSVSSPALRERLRLCQAQKEKLAARIPKK